jgi:hypothetical protein
VGEAEVTYYVEWDDRALTALDEIWKTSHDREAIQNVATRIDTELTFNPTEAGESREGDFRVLFKFPIVVWFRVIERIQLVQVVYIRAIRRG